MAWFWLSTLAKALSAASVVAAASVLAEALGPFWGALVATLPISSGPVYVFLALQHDAAFVAASALTSVAANAATCLFLIVHALAARRHPLLPCLAAALAVWLAASLAIEAVAWTATGAVLLNIAAQAAGAALLHKVAFPAVPLRAAPARRHRDLVLRAAAVATFAVGVAWASTMLGSAGTGVAAVFPISLSSVIVIVGRRIGAPATALLAATALRAMAGFSLALLTVHLTIEAWGMAASLAAALAVSLAWSALLLIGRPRAPRAA